MRTKKKQCNHILTNGQVCNAIPMRDSNFCYWQRVPQRPSHAARRDRSLCVTRALADNPIFG